MLFNVQYSVIVFGAIFSFIMAAGQLFIKDKTNKKYIISGLFFSIGCIQLYHGLIFTDILKDYSYFKLLNIPFIFFLGPFIYMYFHLLINTKNRIIKKEFAFLIPGAVTLVLIITVDMVFGDQIQAAHSALRNNIINTDFLFKSLIALTFLSMAYLIFFFFLLIKKNPGLLHEMDARYRNEQRVSILLVIYFFLPILIIFTGLLLFFSGTVPFSLYRSILLNNAVLISAFPILIFFLSQRHARLLREIEDMGKNENKEQNAGYRQTQLKGIDVDSVLDELKEIMEGEKLFCDEDLSLKKLSDLVSISPHQLSEILNDRLGINFHAYINEYRINEAMHMMLEEPERNLLSIGFAVGFNSKSAFYNAFKRITGKAPGDFRNR